MGIAQDLDIISWDSYPEWHSGNSELDERTPGMMNAFNHDSFRTMKGGNPFILMETSVSQINWKKFSPLHRPGIHRIQGLQAVAHGSDGVCYFQFRKSRGSYEQHQSAVVDHAGHEHTRVFREVADLGVCLEKLSGAVGGRTSSKVALIFDWESWWALEGAVDAQRENKDFIRTVLEFYRPFWERGISVDIIDSTASLDGYDLVLAPMLYLLRPNLAQRLEEFVDRGGTLVCTYQTGITESTGLCFQGPVPGPLRKLLGLWVEEFDALPTGFHRGLEAGTIDAHGLSGRYQASHYFDLIHCETAKALAAYTDDFYSGRAAVTVNQFGKGHAYYIASRNDQRFQNDFFGDLIRKLALPRALKSELPTGVSAHYRAAEGRNYLFVFNFLNQAANVVLDAESSYTDIETGELLDGTLSLAPLGSRVLLVKQNSPARI